VRTEGTGTNPEKERLAARKTTTPVAGDGTLADTAPTPIADLSDDAQAEARRQLIQKLR